MATPARTLLCQVLFSAVGMLGLTWATVSQMMPNKGVTSVMTPGWQQLPGCMVHPWATEVIWEGAWPPRGLCLTSVSLPRLATCGQGEAKSAGIQMGSGAAGPGGGCTVSRGHSTSDQGRNRLGRAKEEGQAGRHPLSNHPCWLAGGTGMQYKEGPCCLHRGPWRDLGRNSDVAPLQPSAHLWS